MKVLAVMNRICRLVENHTLGVMVALAENAKEQGRSATRRKLVAAAPSLPGGTFVAALVQAGPARGQMSAGAGCISQSGSATIISQNLSINWQGLSIGSNRRFLARVINLDDVPEKILTPASDEAHRWQSEPDRDSVAGIRT